MAEENHDECPHLSSKHDTRFASISNSLATLSSEGLFPTFWGRIANVLE